MTFSIRQYFIFWNGIYFGLYLLCKCSFYVFDLLPSIGKLLWSVFNQCLPPTVNYKRESSCVTPGKSALKNHFQQRSLKGGMTLNLTHTLVSVGSSLQQKRVNQQHLNRGFLFGTFMVLSLQETNSTKKKFARENQISKLYAQV